MERQYQQYQQYRVMERRAREQYHSLAVGVWLPFLQSVITGLLLGGLVVAVLFWMKNGNDALFIPVVVLITILCSWILALRWWREMASQYDRIEEPLNFYPLVEPEPGEPQTVSMTIAQDDGLAGEYASFPVSYDKLLSLAHGLSNGASFTEAAWCAGSHGLFTRAEFAKLRDELKLHGLVELNSPSTPARGYRLSRAGRAWARHLAGLKSTQ